MTTENSAIAGSSDELRLGLFEDRYGAGSFTRLLTMLRRPCVSFAQIAQGFSVSRERVRQWHLKFLPDAPRGHQRRRLCLIQHEKRRLLADPLFREFYRHARPHFGSGDFVLIRARDGFRKRAVRLHGRVVIVKAARPVGSRGRQTAPSYALTGSVVPADFIYYRLSDVEYLVVPADRIPPTGTTFPGSDGSRFAPYRNSFAAVRTAPDLAVQENSREMSDGESSHAD